MTVLKRVTQLAALTGVLAFASILADDMSPQHPNERQTDKLNTMIEVGGLLTSSLLLLGTSKTLRREFGQGALEIMQDMRDAGARLLRLPADKQPGAKQDIADNAVGMMAKAPARPQEKEAPLVMTRSFGPGFTAINGTS